MRVSIITVSLNSEKYIAQTIQSVLNQSYEDIEYIIIDGGSSDGTLDIIREFEPLFNGRLEWISEGDQGIYDAMNKGIKLCKGEVIGIINSDDWYEASAIQKVVETFDGRTDIVCGDVNIIKDEKICGTVKAMDGFSNNYQFSLPHQGVFVRKELHDKYGLYDTKYKIAADYKFLKTIIEGNLVYKHIPEPIACFRLGGASGNHKRLLSEYKDINILLGQRIISENIKFLIKYLKYWIYQNVIRNSKSKLVICIMKIYKGVKG